MVLIVARKTQKSILKQDSLNKANLDIHLVYGLANRRKIFVQHDTLQ